MYEQANEKINEGLSFGARLLLGSVSAVFGLIMIMGASGEDKVFLHYLFAAFCLLIALACCTRGRVRQFVGSIVGSAMFVIGLLYLFDEIAAGDFGYGGRGAPSVLNALGYLLFIGLPGGIYATKVRFGFAKRKIEDVEADT